jgi:hypothetical protein
MNRLKGRQVEFFAEALGGPVEAIVPLTEVINSGG